MSASNEHSHFRYSLYALLIVVSAGSMVGRIATVSSKSGGSPFLSANDRSRWCTVRALVDEGTYAIDNIIVTVNRSGRLDRHPEWNTIDKVYHKGPDGRWHFYSSKPPLLPTLVAGPYWLIKQLTGNTLEHRPFYVARTILVLINVIPLCLMFVLMAAIIERFGGSDWGRLLVFVATVFATQLTTFAVTFNNHVPAAVSVTIAVWAALKIYCDGRRDWYLFVLGGFFATFAAACELPALALAGCLALALLVIAPLRTFLLAGTAALVVAAAFGATNYAAHGTIKPAYGHWGDGAEIAALPARDARAIKPGIVPHALTSALAKEGIDLSPLARLGRSTQVDLTTAEMVERWHIWDPQTTQRYALQLHGDRVTLHEWKNWYDFPNSYWTRAPQGIDRGEPSRLRYLFHVLVGHHGVLALSPIFLLSLVGIAIIARRPDHPLFAFAIMTAFVTVVVIGFYVFGRPLLQRNYGGLTCGLRWLFWLFPLWLIVMIPAADLTRRNFPLKTFAAVCLLISAVTAQYGSLNPWVHPWLYRYWEFLGWL